ncbi:ribose 5-phosphate isomerase B [Calditrichota bacterium GD2]
MKKIITERQVAEAAKRSNRLYIDRQTIITPLARDRARELGVQFLAGPEKIKQTAAQRLTEETLPEKIVIGADHGGYYLKEALKDFLKEKKYQVYDVGTQSPEACDYPDYALKVAEAVASGKADRGIMIDSVGIGSAMAANRVPGVLAAKCNNVVEAKSAREHNYANVLTLGAKIIGENMAREIVAAFLTTSGGAERHKKRVLKILNYKP